MKFNHIHGSSDLVPPHPSNININKVDNAESHELSSDYIHDEHNEHEKHEALKMIGNLALLVLLIGIIAIIIDQTINFVYFHLIGLF